MLAAGLPDAWEALRQVRRIGQGHGRITKRAMAPIPRSRLAARLGDLAANKNDLERAVIEYATAFTLPGPGMDPAHLEEVRRKLGSCYIALHQSEKGLGDLRLLPATTNLCASAFAPPFQGLCASRSPNLHDPFAYVLERMDGSPLPACRLPRQNFGAGVLGHLVRPLPDGRQVPRGAWRRTSAMSPPSCSWP